MCRYYITMIFVWAATSHASFPLSFTATIALIAMFALVSTTAPSVICGCRTATSRTTAPSAAFAAWEARKTFNIVTTVVCALTSPSTTNTIASRENTRPIVPSVKNTYLAVARLRTKCPVVTPFTGIASVSWPPTTRVVPSVKRQPRPESACSPRGTLWQPGLPCSLFHRNCAV